MNIPATIEILQAALKDMEKTRRKHTFTRVYYDLNYATTYIQQAIDYLKWAEKHRKELNNGQ